MSTIQGSRVLVTGAASGIGKATTKAFAREGGRMILVDRNEAGLSSLQKELAGGGEDPVIGAKVVDLSTRQGAEEVVEYAMREFGGVDVLMNCAGIVQVSPVLGTTIDEMERLMSVNFWATVIISQGLLSAMVEQQRGHVINIASASGLVGVPAFVAYGTSKFAVVGYSDGIRNELRESGIRVTTVCPGIVETPMKSNLNVKGYDMDLETMVGPGYPVDRLAGDIIRAVQNGTELITPAAKILWFLKRFAPTRAAKYITKQMRVFRKAEVPR